MLLFLFVSKEDIIMLKTTTPFLLLLLIGVIACDLGEKVDEAIITVSGNVSDDAQPVIRGMGDAGGRS